MREFVLVQLFCMLVPVVVVVGICFAFNCFAAPRKRIPLHFDLTTMVIVVTLLGALLALTRWKLAELEAGVHTESLACCSFFVLPIAWWLRHLIECHRQHRAIQTARKALTIGDFPKPPPSPPA